MSWLNICSLCAIPAAEIDRCLKKVAEGLEEFDMIWEKVCTEA
jgi:hypothetical protein